jgi:hypothetical protein
MVVTESGAPEARHRQNATTGGSDVLNGIATERTSLLGSGADAAPESQRDARKDSWVGFKEFDDLPWYKTPSVSDVHGGAGEWTFGRCAARSNG